jgi:hypothetical protein
VIVFGLTVANFIGRESSCTEFIARNGKIFPYNVRYSYVQGCWLTLAIGGYSALLRKRSHQTLSLMLCLVAFASLNFSAHNRACYVTTVPEFREDVAAWVLSYPELAESHQALMWAAPRDNRTGRNAITKHWSIIFLPVNDNTRKVYTKDYGRVSYALEYALQTRLPIFGPIQTWEPPTANVISKPPTVSNQPPGATGTLFPF